MALADFFRSAKPSESAATPPGPNSPPAPNASTVVAAAKAKPGTVDTTQTDFNAAADPTKNADGSPKNPLDSFKGMYDAKDTSADAKPPKFALDPASLETAAKSLKFSSHVTPELAQKLQSGDATALAAAFDELGRSVYQTVMSHQSTLTDRFVDARMSHDRKGLGQSVHSVLTANSLAKLAEKNPVLKEHVTEIGDKIASKFPDATPDWIAEQTRNYFLTVAQQLDPSLGKPAKTVEDQNADINWEEWISAGAKT